MNKEIVSDTKLFVETVTLLKNHLDELDKLSIEISNVDLIRMVVETRISLIEIMEKRLDESKKARG